MNVAVALDHRFAQTADGRLWTDGPFPHSFFARYLRRFDAVRVVARAQAAERPEKGWREVDGPGVEFAPAAYYLGPWEYWKKRREVERSVGAALEDCDAVILRAPSQVALAAEKILRRQGRPYGLEIVADPAAAYSAGAVSHPLRPVFRAYHVAALKRLCREAAATAYVTERALQRDYPPGPAA